VPAAAALTHLQRLEAESIHILREVVAECERPVMLYSVGKDSAVMLQLAVKAFIRPAALSTAARGYHLEVSRNVRVSGSRRAAARHATAGAREPGGLRLE